MSTIVEVLLCPECQTPIQETVSHSGFQSGGTPIGPPEVACPNCGCFVLTGLSEWSDKSVFRKFTFFFGRFVWFVVASFFVAGLFALAANAIAVKQGWLHPKHENACVIVGYSIGTLFMGVAFLKRISKELRESDARVASTQSGSTGESDFLSS